MNKRISYIFAAALLMIGVGYGVNACAAGTPPGVMAISAMPRLDPYPASPFQYLVLTQEAFDLTYNAGARGMLTTFTWKALEPKNGKYDDEKFKELTNALAQAQAHGMVLLLGLQLINTTALEVPDDLTKEDFDSASFGARFRALLDKIVAPNRGRIKYLAIGNEVDGYLREHPKEWARYRRFYENMVQYVHTLDPGIQVGVTGTGGGALTESPAELQDLNTKSDVMILTYYPIQGDAKGVMVRDPSVVKTELKKLQEFAGSKPLVLQEAGYPAAITIGSSDAKQAEFVRQLFAAWGAAPAGKIPFVNFFLLHDFTKKMCADFGVYYGVPGLNGFGDFLCTLGLRHEDGKERPAWGVLRSEAKAAGLP